MTQFFTRPWDSQPQEAAALDRSGAAAGIYACQFPPAGLGRDVSGIPIASSGVSLSAGPAGLAFLFAGAGTSDVSIQTPAAWSVSVLCDASTLSGTCGLFSMGSGAVYSVICRTESGVLKLYQYEGIDKVVTGPTLSAGRLYLISASWTGSSLRIFVNGLLAGSTAVGSIRSSVTWRIGGSVGAAERWTGRAYVASYFTRARADAEHAQEAASPWQLFEPRRIYIPTAAGGAGAPAESGGASSAVAVTAAGAGAATEQATGGASASVAVTSAGAGTASSAASGGASAVVSVSAAGAGSATEAASGGASAAVSITAAGAGTSADGASGGSPATVSVLAAGAGTATEAATGGASAVVLVTAAGVGLALEIAAGGSSASVSVSAVGGGTDGAVVAGTEYVRLYSRIAPAVAAPSLICPTVALSSPLAVLQGLRSTIDLESP